jgi:hypothetical protein
VVKGGQAANLLVKGMQSPWGKALYSKTLITNIAQAIYQASWGKAGGKQAAAGGGGVAAAAAVAASMLPTFGCWWQTVCCFV